MQHRRYKVADGASQASIFPNRDALLAYESALSVAESVQTALEARDYAAAEAAAADAVAAVLASSSSGDGGREEMGAACGGAGQEMAAAVVQENVKAEAPGRGCESEAAPSAAMTESVQATLSEQFTPATVWAGAWQCVWRPLRGVRVRSSELRS